jgi:hypothetical protein
MKPVIDDDGTKRWFLNDKLHRENGPAVVYKHGGKAWYIHGKLHRENGPAIEFVNNVWFLNGKELTQKQFIVIKKLENLN